MTRFKHVGITEYPTDGDDGSDDVIDRTGGDVFSFCCECPTAASDPNPFGAAGGMASGVIELSNLAFYKAGAGAALGAVLVANVNVTQDTFGYTARLIETINGATVDSGALGPSNSLDNTKICSGALCSTDSRLNVDDVFGVFSSKAPTPNDPADTLFAYADQKALGGVFSAATPGNPAAFAVGAATVSKHSDTSSSSANTALAVKFTNITETAKSIDIDFNANEYVEAWLVGPAGSFVSAAITCTITLFDNTSSTTLMVWTPLGTGTTGMSGGTIITDPFTLNSTKLLTTPIMAGMDFAGSALGTKNSAGHFHCRTPVLTSGHQYTITTTITAVNSITGV